MAEVRPNPRPRQRHLSHRTRLWSLHPVPLLLFHRPPLSLFPLDLPPQHHPPSSLFLPVLLPHPSSYLPNQRTMMENPSLPIVVHAPVSSPCCYWWHRAPRSASFTSSCPYSMPTYAMRIQTESISRKTALPMTLHVYEPFRPCTTRLIWLLSAPKVHLVDEA